MGTRITDLDLKRDEIAHEMNGRLIGTGLSVDTSRRNGPYVVSVKYLNHKEMVQMVKQLRAILAERAG
jgi:hypothetical protein